MPVGTELPWNKLVEWCKKNEVLILSAMTPDQAVKFRMSLPFRTGDSSSLSVHWAVIGGFFNWPSAWGTSLPKSCGACLLRSEQARRHLTEDLLVVSGRRPLHMNTSAFYARFLHQPLELRLKKDFQLLRRQEGNGNGRRLAGFGLDPHAIWRFGLLLHFWHHATHPFSGVTKVADKNLSTESISNRR
jgi:hypothetical protein